MSTKVGRVLVKAKMLSDAVAWYESIDAKMRKAILEYIQNDQLTKKGIDEDGDVLGHYSLYTDILTNGRKGFGEHYTLKDTGDFYKSMFVVVLRDALVIEANPKKGDDNLFYKFGEGIIGLTDENLEKLIGRLKTKYIRHVRKRLQLIR